MVLVYVYYYGCYVSLMLERNVAVNGTGLCLLLRMLCISDAGKKCCCEWFWFMFIIMDAMYL